MQLKNPIRSGEMIKGEVSAGCEWREQRQLPARGARAPPGSAGAGGSAAGGARCLGWAARCAELSAEMVLSSHPQDPAPAQSCRRTPGSLTVSQERQQRGQEQQVCRAHGAGSGRAPGRGRDGRAGSSAGLGCGSCRGEGAWPQPPPAPDRISTTASAWRRRRGSPRGAGGGGAGGAAYRKVSSKGAEDPAAGAQAPAPPPAQGKDFPANVGTRPPPFRAAHAQPSLLPSPPLAAC